MRYRLNAMKSMRAHLTLLAPRFPSSALKPPSGKLSAYREGLVRKCFDSICTTDQQVTPQILKNCFRAEDLPAVRSGTSTVNKAEIEFLDTFSIYIHVTGMRSDQGFIPWEGFKGYFQIFAAAIPTDAYFDVVMRRMWGLRVQGSPTSLTGGNELLRADNDGGAAQGQPGSKRSTPDDHDDFHWRNGAHRPSSTLGEPGHLEDQVRTRTTWENPQKKQEPWYTGGVS
jgi:hypothetical protein